jgi:hypothetical protein
MRLALALVGADSQILREELADWMLQVDDPAEVLLIRQALEPHKVVLLDRLWTAVEKSGKGTEHQRLRAAAALAKYEPESPRWERVHDKVVEDFVAVNAVFLGSWTEAFRPVKERLLPRLSIISRDQRPECVAERKLATNLVADYASDQPQVLADLLMDADEKQFAVIYPKLKEHGTRSVSDLRAEIDKHTYAVGAKDAQIFESKGTVTVGDAKVMTTNGPLPAKRFEIHLQGGKKYRIVMLSTDFDPFLVLQNKYGKELIFDKDGGNNRFTPIGFVLRPGTKDGPKRVAEPKSDLNSSLMFTPSSDDTYAVFATSFKGAGSFILKILDTMAEDDGKEKLAKRQANAAIALLKMGGSEEKVWPLLKHSSDPRVRELSNSSSGTVGCRCRSHC